MPEERNPYLELLNPAVETAKTLVTQPWGAIEAGANLVSQMYGLPAAGLAGVAGLPFGKSQEWQEAVGRGTIYEPKTEAGKKITSAVSVPFELLGKASEKAAEWTQEKTGSPLAATVAGTAVQALPIALGAMKGRPSAPKYPAIPPGLSVGLKGTPVTPEIFAEARNKSSRPEFLTPYTPEELGKFDLHLTKKDVGYALTPEKDLVNVFNVSGKKGAGVSAVVDAIKNGAETLDAFDGFFPKYYKEFGFKEVGRDVWNDAYAPKDWMLTKYGKPDIVYMKYEGARDAKYLGRLEKSVRNKVLSGEFKGAGITPEMVKGTRIGKGIEISPRQPTVALGPVGANLEQPSVISPIPAAENPYLQLLKSERGSLGTTSHSLVSTVEILRNTEDAHALGKTLTRQDAINLWTEYNRRKNLPPPETAQELGNRSFVDQMFRETVEGHLGATGYRSLTPKDIESRLGGRKAGPLSFLKGERGSLGEPSVGPVWYSTLENTIRDKMPNQAPVEQVRSLLNTPGVKADEVKWTGMDEWLKGKTGKVTKQETMDFLKQNEVKVEEVTKGEPNPQDVALRDRLNAEQDRIGSELTAKYGDAQKWPKDEFNRWKAVSEQFDQVVSKLSPQYRESSKFSQWQLPGGENYRELRLTLPNKDMNALARVHFGKEFLELTKGQKGLIKDEFLESRPYQSTHFDELNVLAHVRFNDRVDAQGKKVLFIEEVQSDWHQAGRKKGYKTQLTPKEDLELAELKSQVLTKGQDSLTKEQESRLIALEDKGGIYGVPPAPFSKTWHELAMKRMVRWASEKGYDKVAWTTGEQQAARYDLSKQVKEVHALKDKGGYQISVRDNEGNLRDLTTVSSDDKLAGVVGKDLATKIVAGEGRKSGDWQVFSGLDLKVGGEGMKGFYDKIIPEYMNKFGKKWGAKVGETNIDVGIKSGRYEGPEYTLEQIESMKFPTKIGKTQYVNLYLDDVANDMRYGKTFKEAVAPQISEDLAKVLGGKVVYDRTENVHSLDITPSMRESVVTKGNPLFSILPFAGIGGALAGQRLIQEKKKEPRGPILPWKPTTSEAPRVYK